ncbi:MAG: MBL fold metallo-hydrolase [Hyphomicrobiaceae bacterium]
MTERDNERGGGRSPLMTRRTVLKGSAFAIVGGLGASVLPPLATAKEAASHKLAFGAFEMTVVSDGHLMLPARLAAPDAPAAELKAALDRAGITGDMSQPPANVTVIKSGADTILIDTGAGPNFMPTTGRLLANLEAAGIAPDAITKVVFTHGHPDHLWGALDDFEENPRFANATHYVPADEWDFWSSDNAERGMPPDRASFIPAARRSMKGIEDKVQRVKPGDDIVTGIRVVATPGHTQGHVSLEIAGGSETMMVLGDALTHRVISFEHPEWRPAADHVPELAVETRKKLLDRLATDKVRVLGFHLPFPGTGRVEKKGNAYVYVGDV